MWRRLQNLDIDARDSGDVGTWHDGPRGELSKPGIAGGQQQQRYGNHRDRGQNPLRHQLHWQQRGHSNPSHLLGDFALQQTPKDG